MTGDGADSLFTGTRTHSQVIRNIKINKFIVPPFNLVLRKVVDLIPEEAKWRIFLENLSPVDFYSRRETVFNCHLRNRQAYGAGRSSTAATTTGQPARDRRSGSGRSSWFHSRRSGSA